MQRTYRVESIVDQVLQVFAHSDLSHQFVLVAIHASQLADMSENVLQTVRQLESVHIVQPILNVRIDDQFGEAQNFPAQMESVSEPRLFSLLCGQCLNRFQIEIVVQVQVIQVLAMDQQIQHVVSLPAHLQTSFHPVQCCCLEKFCRFERPEQVAGNGQKI